MLFEIVCEHFSAFTVRAPGTSDGFRDYLRGGWLYWVHQDVASENDNTLGHASSCLCPIMAYLQQMICITPMEHWAAGAVNSEDSPLGIAWGWARASPTIGRQTADVAVLVSMGCRIKHYIWCSLLWREPRAEEVGI